MTRSTADRWSDALAARASLAVLLAALVLKVALVVHSLDRGFEIGDEGYYLLNLNRPGNAPEPFQFYRLSTLLGREAPIGVLDARLLRIGAELLASAALVGGVLAWARAKVFAPGAVAWLPFLSFAALGLLLTTGSRSLGYNDATNLCVHAAIGALFWLLSLPSDAASQRRRSGAALLVGVAAGFQLGVKFTSALLLLVIVAAAFVLFLRDVPGRLRLRLVPWLAVGIGLAILVYAGARGGLSPLASDMALLPELARLGGYHPLDLLARLALGEVVTLLHLTLTGCFFAVSLRLLSRSERRSADGRLAVALGLSAALLAVDVTLLHPFFLAPSLLFLSVFLLFLVAVGTLACGRRGPAFGLAPPTGSSPRLGPLLLLLATPVVAMAGTNVPLSMRLPAQALPWILAAAVPLFELQRRDGLFRFPCVAATVLAFATTGIVVQHQLARLYGVPGPAAAQVHAVGGLEGVRVEPAVRDFLEALRESMGEAGFRPGDPILALDYMPGLVFFLGGVSPGWNFYMFDRPDLNCFNFRRASEPGAPFLLLGRPMSEEQQRCLGLQDLARDYRLVAEIPFPYQDVYASFGAPGMTHVRVYAPGGRGGIGD